MASSPATNFRSTVGIEMIRVPAGSFTMGSPESEDGHWAWEQERVVEFASDFCLGKFPVTQAQYQAVTGVNPTEHEHAPNAPVTTLKWESAADYCRALTDLDREAGVLPEDWAYRLPTEAEWEYACRAGTSGPHHGPPLDVAWYHENANESPHPVGQKLPNAWGFHDMLGNVWEWCQDWFCLRNSTRSVRGGSYYNSERFCRAAQRFGFVSFPGRYLGFRVLAAKQGPFDLSPPIDGYPPQHFPWPIFDAIDANDFNLASRIVAADPTAVESPDVIPPPLHNCIYDDRPEMLVWLLDHGANIERRDQDYGATPLSTAIVMRKKRMISLLVARGANTEGQWERALDGLAGAYEEADARLDREGYRDIVTLLQELGLQRSPAERP
ncbi:Serine/threonine-protein kinase pkn1 [Caulifigura coniformis]|uniref:Serine/threonine-protein kinase pkn1 n=1 Tax=Caulifigura coniformis TaxID=2527983 RepID=A0A517SD37_9PLAN|nr:SUMF1/EgtB/PvdO family nonheme iron enzyme [Caulifigura coniformis]QDT54040.1 Serine/threonine-protein kinase pkn1 [Caulifigura coniformis]